MLKLGGACPATSYVFCGNHIGNGHDNIIVLSLLACLKVRHPEHITIIRSGHDRSVKDDVFHHECQARYPTGDILAISPRYVGGAAVWTAFVALFRSFALAALVDGHTLCAHSGALSPAIQTLDQLRVVQRWVDLPVQGTLRDVVTCEPRSDHTGWRFTPDGQVTCGRDVVTNFMARNHIKLIVRSHDPTTGLAPQAVRITPPPQHVTATAL